MTLYQILFCEANVKFYLMAFVGHWKFEDATGLFRSRKSMAKRKDKLSTKHFKEH